ncbi:MAG: metallophosphoesterase family protein [Candidatus Cryptobacteroides sp.]
MMDRRKFLKVSALSAAGLALADSLTPMTAKGKEASGKSYSVVILGDTHYDTDPDIVYHAGYSDPNPEREANHRREFVRNAGMWADRSPRLVRRASRLVREDTRFCLQLGDLIQGDTGSEADHRRYLSDAYCTLKVSLGALPFVTVAGNHDLRAADDRFAVKAYSSFMFERLSIELGKKIEKTCFSFMVGKDAYIVIDFTYPDDEEIDRLFKETEGARYTFVVIHGPVFPYQNAKSNNWILHGKDGDSGMRLHFRRLMAQRNAIVLCGHTHTTEILDWYGDGGRITQMTMNSVWSKENLGTYSIEAEGPASYGKVAEAPGSPEKVRALFSEYKYGIRRFSFSRAAGSYRMEVTEKGVTVEFYAGDSEEVSARFVLR